MTMNRESTPDITPEELDRIEELIQYLANHDGRMPTDEMPLAWWLVDVFDEERGHAVRRALAGIPVRRPGQDLTPKKAHAWYIWLARRDQLVWAARRGQTLEEAVATDKALRDWVNDMLSRHLTSSLGVIEAGLLARTPLWDFDRNPDTKRSSKETIFKIGLNAVRSFYQEHKHTNFPEGYTSAGVDVVEWWALTRSHYASGVLKDHHRLRVEKLGNLGVDLRTNKELAKEAKRKAAEERHQQAMENRRRAREGVVRAAAERRGVDDIRPVLRAIRAFAEKYGHTGIPVGAVTEDGGIEFGRFVDQWRRMYAVRGRQFGGDRELREGLESIPHWTWMRTPESPKIQRPAPVVIPEDTTQMNRAGLRQFLPAD